jgi:VIT1/CCC1 family predicted Fe2+/Mn2+ transporter
MEQYPGQLPEVLSRLGRHGPDGYGKVKVPGEDKRLINPIDRISEILFGLIMALTFTCTISVIDSDRQEVRSLLIGAIGCNIAWGLVDAIMYLMGELTYRGHGARIIRFIKESQSPEKSRDYIAEAVPPILASVSSADDLELLRKRILELPESQLKVRLTGTDAKRALGIFLLVFISTFPVALPFVIFDNPQLALRVSNGVAILLMFIAGWMLGRYGGFNKWMMALAMTVLGILLVLITIALGG